MPPELAARSATMAETMPPAAPVTTKTVSGPRVRPGWPSAAGASASPTVQRSPPAWPISTAPGSASVSSTSTSAISAGLRRVLEVDGLHERVTLAAVRLHEAGDRAAHRRADVRAVVAVPAAEARRRDDEPARLDHAVVEDAQ